MKIKKIQARDIRSGMRKMKQELGDDAVILINRKSGNGVELIVGVDFDQAAFERLGRHGNGEIAQRIAAATAGKRVSPEPTPPKAAVAFYSEFSEQARSASRPAKPASGDESLTQADVVRLQQPLLDSVRRELGNMSRQMRNQMDYLGWGRMSTELPAQADLLRQLAAIGLGSGFCKRIIRDVHGERNSEKAWRRALGIWARYLKISDHDLLQDGGIVALLGPTGVGKTTTAAKLAARFAQTHGRHSVALVANDNQRVGAHEQLMGLGRMLGISVLSASDDIELRDVLQGLRSKKLVLIDTHGIRPDGPHNRPLNPALVDHFSIQRYLVLSCSAQISALDGLARACADQNIQGCILTKLDEAASLGGVLTVVASHRLPLSYITHGPDVPQDIQPARIPLLLSKAVALSKRRRTPVDEDLMAMNFGAGASRVAV